MMNTIVIERNIPIPARESNLRGRPRGSKFPLDKLEVGDSFAIPLGEYRKYKKSKYGSYVGEASLRAVTYNYKKANPGKDFTVRLIPADKTVRVWRIA